MPNLRKQIDRLIRSPKHVVVCDGCFSHRYHSGIYTAFPQLKECGGGGDRHNKSFRDISGACESPLDRAICQCLDIKPRMSPAALRYFRSLMDERSSKVLLQWRDLYYGS